MASRKVALVAWELGAGRGHLEHLRPIIAELLQRGWSVLAAVRHLAVGREVLGAIDPVLRHRRFAIGQAPIFLHRAVCPAVPPSSLSEVLACDGFDDAAIVGPVIQTWRRLIDEIAPAVVIADFSPSVVVAAKGRIPVVMIGNGWTIPPDESPVPPLPIKQDGGASAAAAERRICDVVAEVTAGAWRPDRFVQLLRGDASFIFTPGSIDPYRASRREQVYWPPNLTTPAKVAVAGAPIAVTYLPRHHPSITEVLAALAQVGIPTRAYFGGAQPMAPKSVKVEAFAIDLARALRYAPCAIHHGGLGIASWCMVQGVPQVIVPPDLEKDITAHAIEADCRGVRVPMCATSESILHAIERAVLMTPPELRWTGKEGPHVTIKMVIEACEAAIT